MSTWCTARPPISQYEQCMTAQCAAVYICQSTATVNNAKRCLSLVTTKLNKCPDLCLFLPSPFVVKRTEVGMIRLSIEVKDGTHANSGAFGMDRAIGCLYLFIFLI